MDVELFTTCSLDVHCTGIPFTTTNTMDVRVYPFFKCRYVGLPGIQSVRYRNELKCGCRNQSGTGIRGPTPVPKCSGTGLRYRMPERRCRRRDADAQLLGEGRLPIMNVEAAEGKGRDWEGGGFQFPIRPLLNPDKVTTPPPANASRKITCLSFLSNSFNLETESLCKKTMYQEARTRMQDACHANMLDHHSRHGTVLVRCVQLINGSSHRQNIAIRDILCNGLALSFRCSVAENLLLTYGHYYLLSQQLEGGGHGLMDI
jgi:hypothetical protein